MMCHTTDLDAASLPPHVTPLHMQMQLPSGTRRKLKPIIGDEDPKVLRRRERDRERKNNKRRNQDFKKAEADAKRRDNEQIGRERSTPLTM